NINETENSFNFSSICSSIDKLEKIGLENVKQEIIEKGWSVDQTDKMSKLLQVKSVDEIENILLKESKYEKTKDIAKQAIDDLKILFDYLEMFNVKKTRIKFDISLARGLNYYTGVIFEAVFNNFKDIGSVCGGGRYDQLVGQFCKKQVPAIGFSVGILRIFSILSKRKERKTCSTELLIVPRDLKLMNNAIRLANRFWKCNLSTEINLKKRTDISDMKKYCKKEKIPYLILIGDEIVDGRVVIFDVLKNEESILTIEEVIERF
ncbi:cytoplasmic histidine-tRNA synthetase, partial [Pseudoloma neurophilia]